MPSSSCFYLYTENLSLLVLLPIFACKKDTCQNLPVSLLYFFKITHLYSIKGIGISSVQTSFPYIMMIWKQWQPADMVKLSDFSPFWLCVPAFQQVCQTLLDLLVRSVQALSRRKRGRKNFRFDRINEKRFADPAISVFYHELSVKTGRVTRQNSEK